MSHTVLAALMKTHGHASLPRSVQLRSTAGNTSFLRKATREDWLHEARTRVEVLRCQVEDDPSAQSRRRRAARERAAREQQERLDRALAWAAEMAEIKAKPREKARFYRTDPEATVMKMHDGGFRPASNGQFTTDTDAQFIVGVARTETARRLPPGVSA